MEMKQSSIYFFAFLIVRLSSVFFVQTWFVPDEFWQSLEVAHRLSFGYGYLTWEWSEGIRSLIYPLVFSIPYKAMEYFCFDSQKALVTIYFLYFGIETLIIPFGYHSSRFIYPESCKGYLLHGQNGNSLKESAKLLVRHKFHGLCYFSWVHILCTTLDLGLWQILLK